MQFLTEFIKSHDKLIKQKLAFSTNSYINKWLKPKFTTQPANPSHYYITKMDFKIIALDKQLSFVKRSLKKYKTTKYNNNYCIPTSPKNF